MPTPAAHDESASFTPSRFHLGGCGTRGRRITFDVVSVPGEIAFEAILNVRRRGEAVVFAGIDNELGAAPKSFQSLIELLGVNDRDVPVDFAAHDKGGGGDVRNSVERRKLLVERAIFPRQAELEFPEFLIVVVAVVGNVENFACAGNRGLEPIGLRDDEVGGDAAVGPAAYAEFVRV